MIYTPLTRKAIKVCFAAHKNQVDKSGLPYVFHPFHLAEQMNTEEEVAVALLHDVVEDSNFTLSDINALGFPQSIIEALSLLTHENSVPYMEYVAAVQKNHIARKVKLADLKHNSDLSRLEQIDVAALNRFKKYQDAILLLEEDDVEYNLKLKYYAQIKKISENKKIEPRTEQEMDWVLQYLRILFEPRNYIYYAYYDNKGILQEQHNRISIPSYFPQNYEELLQYCLGPTFCLMYFREIDLGPNFCITAADRFHTYSLDECKNYLLYICRAAAKYVPLYLFENWRNGVNLQIVERMRTLMNDTSTSK